MADRKSDLGAALTGLVVGSIALLILVLGVVKITSATAEDHAKSPPAATH